LKDENKMFIFCVIKKKLNIPQIFAPEFVLK